MDKKKIGFPDHRMGLIHLTGLLDESDFSLIRMKLNENGIEFLSIDKNNQINALVDDFSNVVSFVISSPLAMGLVTGSLTMLHGKA